MLTCLPFFSDEQNKTIIFFQAFLTKWNGVRPHDRKWWLVAVLYNFSLAILSSARILSDRLPDVPVSPRPRARRAAALTHVGGPRRAKDRNLHVRYNLIRH